MTKKNMHTVVLFKDVLLNTKYEAYNLDPQITNLLSSLGPCTWSTLFSRPPKGKWKQPAASYNLGTHV